MDGQPLGYPHPDIRMRTIVNILLQNQNQNQQQQIGNDKMNTNHPLLFIGLQEVTEALAMYLIPALEWKGYRVYHQPFCPYGCAIAVHESVHVVDHSWHPFQWHPSQVSRIPRGFYQVRGRLPPPKPTSLNRITKANSNIASTINSKIRVIKHQLSPSDEQQDCPSDDHQDYQPEIIFTTTHLTPWKGESSTGTEERIQQLQEMEHYCIQQQQQSATGSINSGSCAPPPPCLAIMKGDMNWDDERTAQSKTPTTDPPLSSVLSATDWYDTWLVAPFIPLSSSPLDVPTSASTTTIATTTKRNTTQRTKTLETQPLNPGYTYDGNINPMLGGVLRRRFDRCLIRYCPPKVSKLPSPNNNDDNTDKERNQQQPLSPRFVPEQCTTRMVGQEPIHDWTFEKYNPYRDTYRESSLAPSDHFGLIINVSLNW